MTCCTWTHRDIPYDRAGVCCSGHIGTSFLPPTHTHTQVNLSVWCVSAIWCVYQLSGVCVYQLSGVCISCLVCVCVCISCLVCVCVPVGRSHKLLCGSALSRCVNHNPASSRRCLHRWAHRPYMATRSLNKHSADLNTPEPCRTAS